MLKAGEEKKQNGSPVHQEIRLCFQNPMFQVKDLLDASLGAFLLFGRLGPFLGEKKIKEYTHGISMGRTVYSPFHFCHFLYGFHVGEYTSFIDPSWDRDIPGKS